MRQATFPGRARATLSVGARQANGHETAHGPDASRCSEAAHLHIAAKAPAALINANLALKAAAPRGFGAYATDYLDLVHTRGIVRLHDGHG